MRVWLITVGEPLAIFGDRPLRTGILAETLRSRNHEITWWTSDVDHYRRKRFPTDDTEMRSETGVKVRFLHGTEYRRSLSPLRWINHVQIARDFARLARAEDAPDVILSSLPTLELCRVAVDYGTEQTIPVVIDVRDLWPDEFYKRIPPGLGTIGRLLLGRLESHARHALRSAHGITATSRRYLDWALLKAARPEKPSDAVFTHGYPNVVVPIEERTRALRKLEASGVARGARIFWFVGSLGGSIDLPTVVEAARRLKDEATIQFVISGTGPNEKRLRQDTASLSNVIWTGWVDQAGIDAMSTIAAAGLAPYRTGALMGLPNKIFEYMKFGLPVVIGLEGEATELVEASEAGLSYAPGDGANLAEVVKRLASEPDLQLRLGANAKSTFDREFSSPVVYASMAEHLEQIGSTGRNRAVG